MDGAESVTVNVNGVFPLWPSFRVTSLMLSLVHQVRAQGGSHDYMGTKILDDHRVLLATTGSILVPTEIPRTDP